MNTKIVILMVILLFIIPTVQSSQIEGVDDYEPNYNHVKYIFVIALTYMKATIKENVIRLSLNSWIFIEFDWWPSSSDFSFDFRIGIGEMGVVMRSDFPFIFKGVNNNNFLMGVFILRH